jgi:hypothetical protein
MARRSSDLPHELDALLRHIVTRITRLFERNKLLIVGRLSNLVQASKSALRSEHDEPHLTRNLCLTHVEGQK